MSRHTALRAARVAVAALFVAPVVVLLGPGAALACSCAPSATAQLVGYADTVVVAEVTSIEPPPTRADGLVDVSEPVTLTSTVQTVFKGEPGNPLVFQTAAEESACGLTGARVGIEYVLFIRDGQTGLCTGTAPATPTLVAEVEAVTGPGQVAAPPGTGAGVATQDDAATDTDVGAAGSEAASPASVPWILGAAVIGLLVVGWLLWSRRSRP